MYKIYLDDECLYYPGDTVNTLNKAVIKEVVGDAGSIDLNVPPTNPLVEKIKERQSMITVYKDDKEIFCGEVQEIPRSMNNERSVYAVGEMAFLADSIQPQGEFHQYTVIRFFEHLINLHNSQVESRKRFVKGMVTVTDPNDSLYRYTNYEDTLTAIREKLCKPLDGYLRVRKENGIKYLDLLRLEDYGKACSQPIEFGRNLLDYAENITSKDLATAIIPLGARLEESPIGALEAYTTIESVNDGKDYIYSQDAVNEFGWIKRVVHFDNITIPKNLKAAGEKYLSKTQFSSMEITVTAIDLSAMKLDIDSFECGDSVNVIAKPFGLNIWNYILSKETDLLDLSNNKIEIGSNIQLSYTQIVSNDAKNLDLKLDQEKTSIMERAIHNATQLITNAMGGYVYKTNSELYIMDTNDPETAKKVWRWNINGLGYSSTGINGEYGLAMTMDGAIVADMITSGTLNASKVSIENLSANSIESGTIDASKVKIENLSANNIKSGTIDASKVKIENLSANNIKSGTIDASRVSIENLNANNIKSGTLKAIKYQNNAETFEIDPSGSVILKGYNESGEKKEALKIHDTNIDFYNWKNLGEVVGSAMPVAKTQGDEPGCGIYAKKDYFAAIGVESKTEQNVYYDGIKVNRDDDGNLETNIYGDKIIIQKIPEIGNTVTGTLFPFSYNNKDRGIVVNNGLIENWDIPAVTGKLFEYSKGNISYGIEVNSGLITRWNMPATSGTILSLNKNNEDCGIFVEKGLITGWNLPTVSGTLFPFSDNGAEYGIKVDNGLITNWLLPSETMDFNVVVGVGVSSGKVTSVSKRRISIKNGIVASIGNVDTTYY